ncbi:MAG: SDR family NAD(P)-dependent oxidoreductase [Chloroflexota bacterium]
MTLIAAVTGASRGIGRATALMLAERGYRVFALARTGSALDELAAEARAAGHDLRPIVMDIGDEAARQAGAKAVFAATDGYGVDVLVNNAGYGQMGAVEDVPGAALRAQFEVNVFGLIEFTKLLLPSMRERHHGYIVNLSSAAGRFTSPYMGVYSASKYALESLSDALRRELAPFGVHVVLIEPGPIRSHFGRVAGEQAAGTSASPYHRLATAYGSASHTNDLFQRSSQTVARVILRAVQSPHPRARYRITFPARMAELARVLPDRLVDWGIRRVMD